jgi:hypothetical protein
MPPGPGLLLVVSSFAGDGALSRRADRAVALRLQQLPCIFADRGLFHKRISSFFAKCSQAFAIGRAAKANLKASAPRLVERPGNGLDHAELADDAPAAALVALQGGRRCVPSSGIIDALGRSPSRFDEPLAASSSDLGAAISWTEAVAGLASVVEAEGARLVAVGERRHEIGELGVAVLFEEASQVGASSPSARFADEREVGRGEVGEDERAVAEHIAVQSYPITNI